MTLIATPDRQLETFSEPILDKATYAASKIYFEQDEVQHDKFQTFKLSDLLPAQVKED